jgi:ATP-binding cassette subfamily F protein 3
MVAHDRYFLDVDRRPHRRGAARARDRLPDELHALPRGARGALELAHAAYENQKAEIERIEAFINRFRYQASKAALVQSRVKQLERIERLPPPEGTSGCSRSAARARAAAGRSCSS